MRLHSVAFWRVLVFVLSVPQWSVCEVSSTILRLVREEGGKRREGGREGRKGGKDKEVSMEEQVAILVVYQPGPSLTLKRSGGWEMVWQHYSLFHTISDSFHERAKHFAASLWAKLSWYKRKSQYSTISYLIAGKKTIVECSQVPPKDDTPQISRRKFLWIARKSQKFSPSKVSCYTVTWISRLFRVTSVQGLQEIKCWRWYGEGCTWLQTWQWGNLQSYSLKLITLSLSRVWCVKQFHPLQLRGGESFEVALGGTSTLTCGLIAIADGFVQGSPTEPILFPHLCTMLQEFVYDGCVCVWVWVMCVYCVSSLQASITICASWHR